MSKSNVKLISEALSITEKQVENTLELISGGATTPFIARYRKEMTKGLDEIQINDIREEYKKYGELDERKKTILNTIEEQGSLSAELKNTILGIYSMAELEDVYLPFKPKKKTRASVAKERGLEPLAKIIMKQQERDLQNRAEGFCKGDVASVEDAYAGARDIIAEWVNEHKIARNNIRNLYSRSAEIKARVVKSKIEQADKYKDYFEYSESLRKCPSHRYLAIRRGEQEGFIKVGISPDPEKALETLERIFVKGGSETSVQVKQAVSDGYKRLLQPSIETEFKKSSKEKADLDAIKVFAENLKQLLLQPPLGAVRVLALDPGYRSGCKLVCLDEQGNIKHNETIYPHKPQQQTTLAIKKVSTLVNSYKIDAIAIGNGTAGRETEYFIKKIKFDKPLKIFIVNEDGASIYSASSTAREEFPSYDVTVRGAISIGRRLMDPLSELVKIDPKSLGVGQYQYDVDQNKLKDNLDVVVESCVNSVGVDLNTASKHLLSYVSGLGPQLAQNIVEHRKVNGPFLSRKELLKVKRLGDKAFEQAAGFLRIRDGANVLDNSAVHPESYALVKSMAKDLKCEVESLINQEEILGKITPDKYINSKFGLPTIEDVIKELAKPTRDPRSKVKVFEFAKGIHHIEDLEIGMSLPGIVTNVTNFGAFVDIGIKQNGLVHISNLANEFVSNPADHIKLHQHVTVRVIEVDMQRGRIQLSMKDE